MDFLVKLACLIFLLPLFTFVLLALLHNRIPRHGDWLATGAMGVGVVCSLVIFAQAFFAAEPLVLHWSVDWLPVSDGQWIQVGILIDGLTAVMLVVVTLVSFLVHLYSIKYMEGDKRYGRYYASLLLFSASMLGLVLADNLLFLFIFWELVGLSSYILIGHWFEKKSASDAAIKAFIVTRIGDVGMLLGILICYAEVGSLDYDVLFAAAGTTFDPTLQYWAGIGLFFGAMGKSAQFPFHVWLPDAMEGPTPVSALIHAATMVAAGVYMVGRLYPLFTPDAFLFVAYVGAITALFAATIATVQDDIKKVLAYSTLSQLGYMMLALGVGGYFSGLFHLTTHAFFKAGLFLGSGSVILAMHHEQSMSKYGGLRAKLPKTHWTYLICVLAIAGVPGLSGFFSKDAILADALQYSMDHPAHWFLAFSGFVTVLLTAFYMFRQYFLTFWGKPRDAHAFEHAKESPWQMTVPLIVLASLAVVAGWPGGRLERMMPVPVAGAAQIEVTEAVTEPAIEVAAAAETPEEEQDAEEEHADEEHGSAHGWAMFLSITLAGLGILLAWATYFEDAHGRTRINPALVVRVWPVNLIHRLLWRKYFFDEMYDFFVVGTTMVVTRIMGAFDKYIVDGIVNAAAFAGKVSAFIAGIFDNWIVDGLVNGTAALASFTGDRLSDTETGRVRNYLLFITVGVIGLSVVLVAITKIIP